MHAHPITRSGLVKLPVIFAVIGLFGLNGAEIPAGAGALAYLGASLVASAALGAWRGAVIPTWRDAAGTWISQGNRLTIALWVALIAIKFVLGAIAGVTGKLPSETAGEVFLFLGISFAVQNLVVARRTILADARRAVTA